MTEPNEPAIDAFALSQLGRSIDGIIRAERADLDAALDQNQQQLVRLDSRLDAIAAMVSQLNVPADHVLEPLAALQETVARQQALVTDAVTRADAAMDRFDTAQAEARGQIAVEVARETERLKLIHQAQVEALSARRQAMADELRGTIAVLQAENAALRNEQQRLIADTAALQAENAALRNEQQRLIAGTAAQQESLAAATARADELRQQLADQDAALSRRIDTLKRNARARDSMFHEQAAEIRLAERAAVIREAARAALAEQRLAAISPDADHHGARSAPEPRLASDQSLAAEGWLAAHAPAALLHRQAGNAEFETACGHALADSDFVAAAYRWLLGRSADSGGAAHYQRRLATGTTRLDIIGDLARSREAQARPARLVERLPLEAAAFIAGAYRKILDRNADEDGQAHYARRLESGMSREAIITDLALSEEAGSKKLLVASALRVIAMAGDRHRAGWQQWMWRLVGNSTAETRQAWQAGRMAAMAGNADRAWQDVHSRLDELLAIAEARVAAVAARAALTDAPSQDAQAAPWGFGAVNSSLAMPAPEIAPLHLLEDDSASRTPESIRLSIRAECDGQGGH